MTTSIPSTRSYTYYHAGPLFTLSQLHLNSLLAKTISRLSSAQFIPVLPQDLEQRDASPHSIRDADIQALLSSDLALFTYDGTELDSGTVVEYCIAKFADIPAVILRTDFRGAGDQGKDGEPWNLMSSFWPRTRGVVVDSMFVYKAALGRASNVSVRGGTENAVDIGTSGQGGIEAGQEVMEEVGKRVVEAMREVIGLEARMPRELRPVVYEWIARMYGVKDGDEGENVKKMKQMLEAKETKGLFGKN